MIRKIQVILLTLLTAFTSIGVAAKVNVPKSAEAKVADKSKSLFIRCEISPADFYVRQAVFITIRLYSEDGNIAYVNEESTPYLKKGEFSYISKVENRERPRREVINGRECFAIPIAKYLIKIDQSGKYQLKGGTYSIGMNVPVVYTDPFFGRMRGVETHTLSVTMEDKDFRVKDLPKIPSDFSFTGAVGDFSIRTFVPRGDIIINEEATVLIELKGRGFIGSDIMPEYREAFGKGNKLKSVSQKDNMYFDGSDVISEKVLECEFIPESRDACEIGVVRFGYFNPYNGKYEVAESEPVKVKVESSTVKREAIDI